MPCACLNSAFWTFFFHLVWVNVTPRISLSFVSFYFNECRISRVDEYESYFFLNKIYKTLLNQNSKNVFLIARISTYFENSLIFYARHRLPFSLQNPFVISGIIMHTKLIYIKKSCLVIETII